MSKLKLQFKFKIQTNLILIELMKKLTQALWLLSITILLAGFYLGLPLQSSSTNAAFPLTLSYKDLFYV